MKGPLQKKKKSFLITSFLQSFIFFGVKKMSRRSTNIHHVGASSSSVTPRTQWMASTPSIIHFATGGLIIDDDVDPSFHDKMLIVEDTLNEEIPFLKRPESSKKNKKQEEEEMGKKEDR